MPAWTWTATRVRPLGLARLGVSLGLGVVITALAGCGADRPDPATDGAGQGNPAGGGGTGQSGGSSSGGGGSNETPEGSQDPAEPVLNGPGQGGSGQGGSGQGSDGGGMDCGRDSYEAERVGVNLYLLVDVSGSMRVPIGVQDDMLITRWDAVSGAIQDFIGSPSSDGLDLALSYYPIHGERTVCSTRLPACPDDLPCITEVCDISLGIFGVTQPCVPQADTANDDCVQDVTLEDGSVVLESCVAASYCSGEPTRLCFLDENCAPGDTCGTRQGRICPGLTSCDAADYRTAAVPRTTLPMGADALRVSLEGTEPDSFSSTPTHVALSGAYTTVDQWIQADPDRRSVLVLATDGNPAGCESTDAQGQFVDALEDTTDVIQSAHQAGIDTFVIGVLDPEIQDLPPGQIDYVAESRQKLTLMAEAGGTELPSFVTSDDTTAESFLAALDKIRGSVVPCEFKIPDTHGQAVLDKLNVEVTRSGETSVTPKVAAPDECGAMGGWYYDTDVSGSGADPKRVILCPASCEAVTNSGDTKVDIVIGCQTIVIQNN